MKLCRRSGNKGGSLGELQSHVLPFIDNLEQKIKTAFLEEKKLLTKKCIAKIMIEQEKKIAIFHLSAIPVVSSSLEELNIQHQSRTAIDGTVRTIM